MSVFQGIYLVTLATRGCDLSGNPLRAKKEHDGSGLKREMSVFMTILLSTNTPIPSLRLRILIHSFPLSRLSSHHILHLPFHINRPSFPSFLHLLSCRIFDLVYRGTVPSGNPSPNLPFLYVQGHSPGFISPAARSVHFSPFFCEVEGLAGLEGSEGEL